MQVLVHVHAVLVNHASSPFELLSLIARRMGVGGARKPAYGMASSGPISQPLVGSGLPSQPLGGGGLPGAVPPQTQTAPLVSDLHLISDTGESLKAPSAGFHTGGGRA